MCLNHSGVNRAQFGARLVETHARSQAAEQLGHAMDASGDHCGGEMMGTGHHVGDDLGFRGIWHRWLQHTDDSGRACVKSHGFADHRRIALEHVRPKAISKNTCAGGVWTVVVHVEQPAEHRVQAHHLEVRSAHDAGPHLARLSQTDHSEADSREVPK